MTKRSVLHAHRPDPTDVFSCRAGENLAFERRGTKYPGWIWCTDEQGAQAWVPEAYVSIVDNSCTLRRDYSSRELHVEEGDLVEVMGYESGWAWVRDEHDRVGWIPGECLEPTGK
jgi:hypothetical protein